MARRFGEGGVRRADDAGADQRLQIDRTLRRLCGWTRAGAVPSEATFSRAFAGLPCPASSHGWRPSRIVWSGTSAGCDGDARERATRKPKRRRGRPRKGEQRPPRRRLERQQTMTLSEMLAPRACDVKESWTGYKLHIDAADGGVPVSCILTSASLHDSQVALPLAHLTAGRVTNLYDLMDSAYDAKEIRTCSELGHVPIIDPNPRPARASWRCRGPRPAGRALNVAAGDLRRIDRGLYDHPRTNGLTVGRPSGPALPQHTRNIRIFRHRFAPHGWRPSRMRSGSPAILRRPSPAVGLALGCRWRSVDRSPTAGGDRSGLANWEPSPR